MTKQESIQNIQAQIELNKRALDREEITFAEWASKHTAYVDEICDIQAEDGSSEYGCPFCGGPSEDCDCMPDED